MWEIIASIIRLAVYGLVAYPFARRAYDFVKFEEGHEDRRYRPHEFE